MQLGKMTMKKIALSAAIAAALAVPSAFADVYVTSIDSFGTPGSTADQSTDVNEILTVDGWSSAAVQAAVGAGATLNSITIYVQASMSTEGSATNTGTDASVTAQVAAFLGDWKVTSQDDGSISHVFAQNGSSILVEDLGVVESGETVTFGPIQTFTTDTNTPGTITPGDLTGGGTFSPNSGDLGWFTIYSGAPGGLESLNSLSFLFETHTFSAITGSSNFNSSFSTATYGAVKVEYDYTPAPPPPQVPTPAPLAMMGLGLLGLAACRRVKRS